MIVSGDHIQTAFHQVAIDKSLQGRAEVRWNSRSTRRSSRRIYDSPVNVFTTSDQFVIRQGGDPPTVAGLDDVSLLEDSQEVRQLEISGITLHSALAINRRGQGSKATPFCSLMISSNPLKHPRF